MKNDTTTAVRNGRDSNIELLRILAACGVVILHYNNPAIGGGIEAATGLNHWFLMFMECISVTAVNVFILISGYFMCRSNKRSLLRPLELILQVILIKEAIYLLTVVLGRAELSGQDILTNLIPNNWFVILYVVLYLISPFLNLLLDSLKKNGLEKKSLIILFILFSVFPTALDVLSEITGADLNLMSTIGIYGSNLGYTIVNFALVYLIGAYLRDSKIHGSILRFLLCLALLFTWSVLELRTGTPFIYLRCLEYCNPLVIWLAAEALLLFRGFKTGSHKWINIPAKASFTVYLVHASILPVLHITEFAARNIFILTLHLIGCVIGIYIVCFIVWLVYDFIMSRLIRATLAKTSLNNNIFDKLN
ncbi:MAG: acyltransferase [Eubacterium sp.]|nr:acyltransferase [Eubacterium sp.]